MVIFSVKIHVMVLEALLSGHNTLDIKTVGALMGHSGLKHTMVYPHKRYFEKECN